MNLIELTTRIGGIKIFVRLLDSVQNSKKLPEAAKIYETIKKEFDIDLSYLDNAIRIKQALQPFCLEVQATPPGKGFSYSYTLISKK